MRKIFSGLLILSLGLLFAGCSDSSNPEIIGHSKAITSFSFDSLSAEGTITEASHSIDVIVPFGTDLTELIPTITHTGVSISPESNEAHDFSDPVLYTVTAEDSSTQDYTVTVTSVASNAKTITGFRFETPSVEGIITESLHTIDVTVPFGTDVTALTPTIVHTGVYINPESGIPQDFNDPLVYTITAEDSSTQDYTVTVTVAESDAKEITSFGIVNLSVEGTITESSHSIDVTAPSGTDLTALTPTIVHTGVSLVPLSGVSQDFTNPVVYTVTAADSSTIEYTVTVTVADFTCGDRLYYAEELYPTVQIDTQCWFAKNLNIGEMVLLVDGQGISCSNIEKYCYGDIGNNCLTYGGLYTWTQAMCENVQAEHAQGICPAGWHIPSDPDYVTLTNFLGNSYCSNYRAGNSNYCGAPAGDMMKAEGLCQGRDYCGDSGFNALLGGYSTSTAYGSPSRTFGGINSEITFWTSSKAYNNYESWRSGLTLNGSGVDGTYFYSAWDNGKYIRCVKD